MKKIALAVAAVLGASLLLAGCGKATEQFKDSGISSRDTSPAEMYDMPDGVTNFAEKCDKHGNRIVVAFHADGSYAALTAIPHDPTCAASK